MIELVSRLRPHATIVALARTVLVLLVLVPGASPLVVSASVAAQTVEGRVEGAQGRLLVSLLGDGDRVVARGVSDRSGAFQLPVPTPGPYRVRVDRPGREAVYSDWSSFDASGRTTVELEAPNSRVDLRPLPEPSSGECSAVGAYPDRLSAAWREAEQALRLFTWAETSGEILLDATLRRRELETDGFTVVAEEQPVERVGVQRITPPEYATDLVQNGFIREAEDGSYRYFAVTPEVLLDPAFHETHCFRLRESDGSPVLGLAFEPRSPAADPRPDVAGVLWVDASQGLPVLLEYGYRNVDPNLVPASVGGESTFTELPDGSWALAESWQRLPVVQLREDVGTGERTWSVLQLYEERVRLTGARDSRSGWVITPESGRVGGRVLDPTGEPMAAATVKVLGTPWEASTDTDGEFAISGLLDGAYRVAVEHPDFDRLPLGPAVANVEVRNGAAGRIRFEAPTPREAAARLCQRIGTSDESVALIGQVRDSISGEPLVGVTVGVRYPDPRREGTPYHESRVASGAGGFYLYCDAPAGQRIRLRAQAPGADAEDDVEVIASSGVLRKDLMVELSTEAEKTGLFGVIRDQDTGRPIEQALITVEEIGRQGLTNRNGFFSIADVEPGLYVLDVTHIGYSDRELVVRVQSGAAMQIDVELRTDAIPIEGITVSVLPRRLFADMVDLQRRMALGFGDYLVREDLEIRGGTLATAMTGRAGVRVMTGNSRAGERFVVLRRARDVNFGAEAVGQSEDRLNAGSGDLLEYCFPSVWVDGRRWSQRKVGGIGDNPVDFTQFVTQDVEAVEIYKGAASVPGEFGGGDAACGAVVVWTRRGGRMIRGEMGSGRRPGLPDPEVDP